MQSTFTLPLLYRLFSKTVSVIGTTKNLLFGCVFVFKAGRKRNLHNLFSSDATKFSSARLSLDLAQARGLLAQLGSAIFEPARVLKC